MLLRGRRLLAHVALLRRNLVFFLNKIFYTHQNHAKCGKLVWKRKHYVRRARWTPAGWPKTHKMCAITKFFGDKFWLFLVKFGIWWNFEFDKIIGYREIQLRKLNSKNFIILKKFLLTLGISCSGGCFSIAWFCCQNFRKFNNFCGICEFVDIFLPPAGRGSGAAPEKNFNFDFFKNLKFQMWQLFPKIPNDLKTSKFEFCIIINKIFEKQSFLEPILSAILTIILLNSKITIHRAKQRH